MNLASRILIFTGGLLLIFGGYLIYERYNPQRLGFKNFEISQSSTSQNIPIRITIPSQNIDLGIYPAKIDGNKWEATTKGVSHLSSSPIPGARGNSILYGHNWSSLLGPLSKIKVGDKIQIELSNGEKYEFTVKFTSTVSSDQTHVLSQTDDTRITLYTCTGFLDSKRFVAVAFRVV